VSRVRYGVPLLVGACSALAIAIGSFGDWARGAGDGLAGLDRDGEATLAAGVVGLGAVLAFLRLPSHRELWAGLALAGSAVATALGLDNMAEINAEHPPSGPNPVPDLDVAWGLWLVILGGIVLGLVAVLLMIALASERRE
jgi:hypothetical protein